MPKALTAFLLLSTFLSISMAATRTEFVSANLQYSVELSKTPEDKLLVTVFHAANEVKTLHWSRAVGWEDPHLTRTLPNVHVVKALITNDGNTVVLRDSNTPQEKNGIRIIRRDHSKEMLFTPFQGYTLTAANLIPPPYGPMRVGTGYLHVGSLLDFITEDQNSYA